LEQQLVVPVEAAQDAVLLVLLEILHQHHHHKEIMVEMDLDLVATRTLQVPAAAVLLHLGEME
jgi:hypothetical protein